MNTISQFKGDLWNGIYNQSKKLLLPTFVVGLIYFVVAFGLIASIFLSFFDMDTFREMTQNSSSNPFDPEIMRSQTQYFEEMMNNIGPSSFIAAFGLIYLFLLVALSWFTNVMLRLNQDQVISGETNIAESLKQSFNMDLFKFLILYILMLIFGFVLIASSAALATINVGLSFLAIMFSWIIMNRFLAAPGAIVHGRLSVPEAIAFSIKNITFKRAAKASLVQIVIFILLFLAMLLVTATSAMLGSFGVVVGLILQVAIGLFLYAFMFTSLSAAFFRYADVEVETDETTHLVEEI